MFVILPVKFSLKNNTALTKLLEKWQVFLRKYATLAVSLIIS